MLYSEKMLYSEIIVHGSCLRFMIEKMLFSGTDPQSYITEFTLLARVLRAQTAPLGSL